jgi:hypothetical protein
MKGHLPPWVDREIPPGCHDCGTGHSPALCPKPYLRCDRCNYDTHTCPGCGGGLQHGVAVCSPCSHL